MYHVFLFVNFHPVFLLLLIYKDMYMNNMKKTPVVSLSVYKVLMCSLTSPKNENQREILALWK